VLPLKLTHRADGQEELRLILARLHGDLYSASKRIRSPGGTPIDKEQSAWASVSRDERLPT